MNVRVRDPLAKMPVSHDLLSAVAECDTPPSLLVQVTVSPTLTVTVPGWNEKSLMDTAELAPTAAPATTIASATLVTTAPRMKDRIE